jgi:hypothetical protein
MAAFSHPRNPEHQAMIGSRHRADRPAGREPLSLRGHGRGRPAYDDCIENIDIGGPAMIRAAAKNHGDVAVVVEPSDYGRCSSELEAI